MILIWSGNNPDKHAFLSTIFNKKSCLQIKLVENIIVVLPFLLFLVVKGYYLEAGVSLFAGLLLAHLSWANPVRRVIPRLFQSIHMNSPLALERRMGSCFCSML
jgi:hypothetical protein